MNLSDIFAEKFLEAVSFELAEASKKLKDGELNFAHYTSADSAYKILCSNTVYLRNVRYMNDWHEVEYGRGLLIDLYLSETGNLLKNAMNKVDGDFQNDFETICNSVIGNLERTAFIMSISQHFDSENETGRLSMWRAYGGKCGVAIVLNHDVFASTTDALGAYSAPVLYYTRDDVDRTLVNLANFIERYHAFITPQYREYALSYLEYLVLVLCLCVKHPGFREEKEWRIFHVKGVHSKGKLKYRTESLGGIPQEICVLPLEDFSADGIPSIAVKDLVKNIIIGPTEFDLPTMDTFISLLQTKGVSDAHAKITNSGIPLRQS